MNNKIINGDCIEELKKLPENSVDAIVTDPPYGLEFMGKEWDKFKEGKNIAGGTTGKGTPFGRSKPAPSFYQLNRIEKQGFQDFTFNWAKECLRVLKPGGFLLSFGGTRTYHRMACGIEDAGFEIRDCIQWLYGSGFPKSLNIGKAIDKLQGNEREVVGNRKADDIRANNLMHRATGVNDNSHIIEITKGNSEWEGWGTALKPANEPIVVARKPLSEKNVALNVLKWGTGGINIDATRIGYSNESDNRIGTEAKAGGSKESLFGGFSDVKNKNIQMYKEQGRFPANIILECTCDEVIEKPEKTKEPEEVKGGIWNSSQGKPAGRTYKGGVKTHTNPNCPCRMLDEQSGIIKSQKVSSPLLNIKGNNYGRAKGNTDIIIERGFNDKGGASRFFYCPKASKSERNKGCEEFPNKQKCPMSKESRIGECINASKGMERFETICKNNHPTVKPIKLMQYLVRLVTKNGGVVLDPFLGSGTTAIACVKEGMQYIGIEQNKDYCKIAEARLKPFMVQERLI